MTSRSASPSEGEIVESDSEKATKSLPSTKDTSVDRPSRPRAASPSRSPSPYRSPRRRDYRSRSRSPYRAPKRAREDDHYSSRHDRKDPRSSRLHYDDRQDERRGMGRGSYRDLDRGPGSSSDLRYDDRRATSSSREKRPRTVSRSPPRFSDRRPPSKTNSFVVDKGGKGGSFSRNAPSRDGPKAWPKEQSVRMRGTNPGTAAPSKTDAEQTKNQAQKGVSFKLGTKPGADDTDNSQLFDEGGRHAAAAPESVDEATLIEQRRKRREAILAKHKTQSNPLLVQALTTSNATTPSDSLPDTPNSASQAIDSLQISPPATPNDTSGTDSPSAFEVVKDSDLANNIDAPNGEPGDDGPSAADYDPTMDMQEDILKQDSRQHGDDVPASAYDETRNNNQDVLIPDAPDAKPSAKKVKDEFDMFADEEDADDMFAEAAPGGRQDGAAGNSAKAVPIPASKAIDMSMLDDWDDPDGYYKIILGELLDKRYHVQLNLGKGMFSGVVRAMDQVTQKLVAIKIIRSNDTMRKAALKEIDILGALKAADPEDKKHIVRLERCFEHKGHLCMVFENLSINLREVLKKFGRDIGINLKAIRAYAQQMFLGLTLLRKCKILHADLKPDNILVNEARNMLKICDLGSASLESENEITPYLVSRFYRAPEIILGLPYDFAIDMWSIGCTLFELYTGKILFTGRSNNQMLRTIMDCCGKFPQKMLRKAEAEFAVLHFDLSKQHLPFRSVERDKVTGKDTIRMIDNIETTRNLRIRLLGSAKRLTGEEAAELNHFVDLLERCLNLNPEKRIKPADALKHPFIMRTK